MIKPEDIARVIHNAEQAVLLGEHPKRTWGDLSAPEQHQRTAEVISALAGIGQPAALIRSITNDLRDIGDRIYREHVAEKIVAGRVIMDNPPPEEDEIARILRNEGA